MSKRLQVILADDEFAELQRAAASEGLTVSGLVRQSLRQSRRQRPEGDVAQRLAAVRAAARHAYPTGDIDQVLAEIQQGYLTS